METLFRRLKTDFSPQKTQIRGPKIKICPPKPVSDPVLHPHNTRPPESHQSRSAAPPLARSKVQAQEHPSLSHRA